MLDWLFKPAQPVTNGCSREVKVTSSRHGTKVYTLRPFDPSTTRFLSGVEGQGDAPLRTALRSAQAVSGDLPVDAILLRRASANDALRAVADNLPVAEPGEFREIKTSFP